MLWRRRQVQPPSHIERLKAELLELCRQNPGQHEVRELARHLLATPDQVFRAALLLISERKLRIDPEREGIWVELGEQAPAKVA